MIRPSGTVVVPAYLLDDTLVSVHLTTTDPDAVTDSAFVNASSGRTA